MEEHHRAVGGQMTVRFDIPCAGRMCGRDGGERVLDDTVGDVSRGDQPAVREHARARGAVEPAVGHDTGGSAGLTSGAVRWATSATDPANAVLMPLSASVNSLGMIQSLLDALSAILGSVCRYW